MESRLPAYLALASLIFFSASSFSQIIRKFPVIPLSAGIYIIKAEVASNDEDREQGLMFREKMAQNEGMIFYFDDPHSVCMWMKNTLLPLSVAFLDEDGKIINIEDMQPETTNPHCAKRPARYALEMNLDWFKNKNIKPGHAIDGMTAGAHR